MSALAIQTEEQSIDMMYRVKTKDIQKLLLDVGFPHHVYGYNYISKGYILDYIITNFAFNIICITYQIYYIINNKKTEQVENIQSKNIFKKINFKKIFFIISISCWVIYFLMCIHAFFFGFIGGTRFEPGIEAFVNAFFLILISYSVIPILPISLIYIIIYLKKNKSKKNDIDIKKNEY